MGRIPGLVASVGSGRSVILGPSEEPQNAFSIIPQKDIYLPAAIFHRGGCPWGINPYSSALLSLQAAGVPPWPLHKREHGGPEVGCFSPGKSLHSCGWDPRRADRGGAGHSSHYYRDAWPVRRQNGEG